VPVGVAVVVGLALLAAVFAVRILIGATGFGAPDNPGIFLVRATPFAVAAVVGAALATSGVLLQSLLRNPLASPWILGLSAGAGLGVSIEIYLRQRAAGVLDVTPSFASPLFALAGAAGALALVYWLARRRGLLDPPALVLVGVMISITCGAATMFVQQLLPDAGLAASARWAMGRIPEHAELWHIGPAAALTAIGLAIAIRDHRALDIASLSDDEAASIGVNLPAIRRRMFVIAAVLSGGAVVLAGPIGFVGLVCPHAVRLIAGPRHATLLIGSALLGAAALALAELAAAAVTTNAGRIPVGVITAIIGGPLFILLLRTTMLGPARAGPGP
jgi:iron complex transport system permease protein